MHVKIGTNIANYNLYLSQREDDNIVKTFSQSNKYFKKGEV